MAVYMFRLISGFLIVMPLYTGGEINLDIHCPQKN